MLQPGQLLDAVRASSPLVQNLTNSVVTNMSANVLLALGAAPAMVDIVGEAGPFAEMADGVLVNLGTPATEHRDAMREAVEAARAAGTPWVLDPVAIGALPIRTALAHELLEDHPSAIRGNASEILALAGAGAGGRGVDSAHSIGAAAPAANDLARRTGSIVAVSGPTDFITDGERAISVANGHELLTKVTGAGCALGSTIAAFLGARGTFPALDAVVAAHVVYGIAAQDAASGAAGPGTFLPLFLDALSTLTAGDVDARARLESASIPSTPLTLPTPVAMRPGGE